MVCTLLGGYYDPSPMMWKIWPDGEFQEKHPTMSKYWSEFGNGGLFGRVPGPGDFASAMLAELHFDLASLRSDLIEYLLSRIAEMEKEIDFCFKYGLYFDGWKRGDMVRMAYVIKGMDDGGPALTLEQMRGKKWPVKYADFDRWRAETSALAQHEARNDLFAEFSRIEDELDPCLDALKELAIQVDRDYENEMDLIRGK